jgi:hypothetical protein
MIVVTVPLCLFRALLHTIIQAIGARAESRRQWRNMRRAQLPPPLLEHEGELSDSLPNF